MWSGNRNERSVGRIVRLCDEPNNFSYVYEDEDPVEEKIRKIGHKVYHAKHVFFYPEAKKKADRIRELGLEHLPICMAKTQYSFSDDPALLGAPRGFTVKVRDLKVSAGAGFIVALTGTVMTMPGLPKVPSAEKIDIDENGVITGLF